MAFNIEELKETLELNRSEIMHNHSLTNEYMIDDIMRELGYNKRRNKDVKRLLDKPIDWEVLSTGSPRLAVKVFALGDAIDNAELQESMNYCKDKPFSIFIVTNGEAMTICRYNKVKREYTEVCDISLLENLTDTKKSVLEAISNDGFNLEIIDNIVSERDISPEKVKDVMKSNLGILASYVATWLGDSSNSKIEQCKVVIDSLFFSENNKEVNHVDVTEYTTIIDELKKELEEVKQTSTEEVDITEYTNKIAELQNKVAEYEAQIEELSKESAESSSDSDFLQKTVDELTNELNNKKNEIESLNSQIEELRNSNSTTNNVDTDIQAEIDTYREKIQELSSKVAESDELIASLRTELKEANDNLQNMPGADKQKAIDLLNVIEDSKELPRSYVAVINTELIQYDDLPTFVGRSLQKLYEIKNYEASQFIFNGDIFKLVQPAERNDLIMNNKAYDVKVEGIHEDEVLNKLRIVYSHFSDIIFECKKIGSLEITEEQTPEILEDTYSEENDTNNGDDLLGIDKVNNTDETEITESTEDDIELDVQENTSDDFSVSESNIFGSAEESFSEDGTFKVSLDKQGNESDNTNNIFGADKQQFNNDESFTQEAFNENEFNDGSFEEESFSEAEVLSEAEFSSSFDNVDTSSDEIQLDDEINFDSEPFANIQSDNGVMLNAILCSQLLQVDELIWSDEHIEFNTIKYIGSSSINFNINMNCEAISNEQLFCKSLDAILALAISMGNINILSVLRQTDLSKINNFIKLYTEEYAEYPRINGTRYAVAGIESVQQVASILADTCNTLGIDTSDIFLFFDASTPSQQLIDTWGYEEEAIQLREYTDIQVNDVADAIVVLKGGIFNNIIVTKNSLQAHKAIFKNTLAVRTNYLAKVINNESDFVDIIKAIITEASMNGQYANINSIGNVIGEQYKLVSENPSETNDNSIKIDVNGREIYVSVVENWQMPLSIIKTHTALLANTSIAVKLSINSQALNFYLTEFEVAEPSLSLAVSSFCNYVKSCIK
jgi:peptidoglycan hydrolase CwlO-like protein